MSAIANEEVELLGVKKTTSGASSDAYSSRNFGTAQANLIGPGGRLRLRLRLLVASVGDPIRLECAEQLRKKVSANRKIYIAPNPAHSRPQDISDTEPRLQRRSSPWDELRYLAYILPKLVSNRGGQNQCSPGRTSGLQSRFWFGSFTLARLRFPFGRQRSTYPCSSRSAAGLDRTEQKSYQPPHERRGTYNSSLPREP